MDVNKKVYSEGWIWFASYFGGPFAGCYLMSRNFEAFGNIQYAEKSFRIGIISTLLFFFAFSFIPKDIVDILPEFTIPLIYTSIIAGFVQKYQTKDLNEHIKNGGKKYSGWKVFGISIISTILTLAYFAFVFIIMGLLGLK